MKKYLENFKFWMVAIPLFLLVFYVVVYTITGTERGIFGETFGAANALFSGLAFAGIIITLYRQKDELSSQRADLNQQAQALEYANQALNNHKEEMAQQKKMMDEQLKQVYVQKIESTVFTMLGQYDNVISRIQGRTHEPNKMITEEGRGYIAYFAKLLKNSESINSKDIQFTLANYVNYLYQIFNYIDSAKILNDEDKAVEFDDRHKYCSIVTSFISFNEMLVLKYYINAITEGNCPAFKVLADKYALFENIRLSGADGKLYDVSSAFYADKAKEKFLKPNK